MRELLPCISTAAERYHELSKYLHRSHHTAIISFLSPFQQYRSYILLIMAERFLFSSEMCSCMALCESACRAVHPVRKITSLDWSYKSRQSRFLMCLSCSARALGKSWGESLSVCYIEVMNTHESWLDKVKNRIPDVGKAFSLRETSSFEMFWLPCNNHTYSLCWL